MITLINALIANHLLILFVAVLATIYLNSDALQRRISFKMALYSFYSCLIVGFLFVAFGNPMHIFTTENIGEHSFLSHLKANDSVEKESSVSYSEKATPTIYRYTAYSIFVSAVLGSLYFFYCFIILVKSRKKLKLYRNIKSIRICTTPERSMPYVFSLMRTSYIVVPEDMIKEKKHIASIIRHELQHIRNLDTQLFLFMSFLKSVLFINPMSHRAFKVFRQLHELAVDTEIVRKNDNKSYLETLSWVFHNSHFKTQPQLTNGFFGLSHLKEYKMRILNINNTTQKKNNMFAIATMIFIGIFGVSCVSHLCKDKLSVNSLEGGDSTKEHFIVKFNMTGANGKKSSMTALTSLNKESVMINSDDSKWLEELDPETMEIPAGTDLDYKKVRLVIEESKDGWARVRIKGTVVENKKTKEFEISNRVPLNEKMDIAAIGADIMIKKK